MGFPSPNNPQKLDPSRDVSTFFGIVNLDPSDEIYPDFWGCFGREKPLSYKLVTIEMWYMMISGE